MTVYFLVIRKEQNIESLYNAVNKTDKIKKEIKEIEKLISKYINQRKIKKILFKGLKKNTIKNIIDNKTIILYRTITLDRDFNFYQYIFIIRETDNTIHDKENTILSVEIEPDIFNIYLKTKINSFHQNKITSQQIINYLKTTIGIQ